MIYKNSKQNLLLAAEKLSLTLEIFLFSGGPKVELWIMLEGRGRPGGADLLSGQTPYRKISRTYNKEEVTSFIAHIVYTYLL